MSTIINDLIDAMKESVHHRSTLKIYLVLLVVLGGLFASLLAVAAVDTRRFLSSQGIAAQRRFVPTYDGKELATIILYPKSVTNVKNHSIPVVLLFHGINENKEILLTKGSNFARYGFVAVCVDQRGHGETNAYASIAYQEVDDVSAVIDWMARSLPQVNASNVGLVGQSLGGMVALIAQTRDPRVVATVALNTPSNLTVMMDILNLDKVFTSVPEMSNNPDAIRIRSPIFHVTEENTRNLLLIHGKADSVVNATHSEEVYEKVGGSHRDDVALVEQPGLTHGTNQANETNLKLAIQWMRHYLMGKPYDHGSLIQSTQEITIVPFSHPTTTTILIFLAWFVIVEFLLLCHVFMKTDVSKLGDVEAEMRLFQDFDEILLPGEKERVKVIFSWLLGAYFAIYLGCGLFSRLGGLSIIEAYFLVPPLFGIPAITVIIYRLSAFNQKTGEYLNKRMGLGLQDFGRSMLINLTTFWTYILLANWVARTLYAPVINVVNTSFLYYVFLTFVSNFFDVFFIRVLANVAHSHVANWIRANQYKTLATLKFLTAVPIFFLYPQVLFIGFPVSINWLLVLMAIGGTLFLMVYIHVYEKVNRNLISAVLFTAMIVAAYMCLGLFRIL